MSSTHDDWKNVISSDGSTFYVLKRKNQCKIWRLEKEKLLRECLQQMNTGDGEKVGIWDAISGFGTTNARIYTENINGQLYCDVLQNEVKQFLAKTPATARIIFLQDLAPWHISNIVKEKIVKLKLNVSGSKPGRNAVVNSAQEVGHKADLFESSSHRTSSRIIDKDLCVKLVESMSERIQKCLKAKGGHFV